MTSYLDRLNLRPFEKRLVVASAPSCSWCLTRGLSSRISPT